LLLFATFWAIFDENWAIFCFSILATLTKRQAGQARQTRQARQVRQTIKKDKHNK
jgi:hypothetical protein